MSFIHKFIFQLKIFLKKDTNKIYIFVILWHISFKTEIILVNIDCLS